MPLTNPEKVLDIPPDTYHNTRYGNGRRKGEHDADDFPPPVPPRAGRRARAAWHRFWRRFEPQTLSRFVAAWSVNDDAGSLW